jgi:hypothetical protein
MNEYTFKFGITPSVIAEYEVNLPPFRCIVRDTKLALKASAADDQQLREQARQVANDLAKSLSYELRDRFKIQYQGRDVLHDTGQQSVALCLHFTIKPARVEIDTSTLEFERQQVQERVFDLTRREALDPALGDMLEHWRRYEGDPDNRLHSLYDVLQVAERLYGNRKKIALALNVSVADLTDLGRISNDRTLINGRHPGESPGPHRIATEVEGSTCERIARTLIENYAAKVAV